MSNPVYVDLTPRPLDQRPRINWWRVLGVALILAVDLVVVGLWLLLRP